MLLLRVTQLMVAENRSPDLKGKDCDWLGQLDQKAIETAPQSLDGYIKDTSSREDLGGGHPDGSASQR